MKTSAYLYEYEATGIVRVSTKHPNEFDKGIDSKFITPLYTAAEIANFVKGLYSDDDFHLERLAKNSSISVFTQIAEKIEKER